MISVLYVDDDPVLLDIGKLYLEQSGTIQVEILDSASTALEKIRTTRYDAVVSDFQMPEMDGIAFLKAVRAEYPFLPFIIFSGKAREDIIIEALNNGADHYSQKGGDPRPQFTDLIHKIERSVERKQAQDTIIHLSRLNAVLSSTNRAVLRIRNRTELLNEACRIAVEEGKFLMAWIGMINPEERSVNPVAACGYEDGYLSNISISVDNIPGGMGLTGTAIRERRSVISNDIESDPLMAHYIEKAARRGYRSSASIPMNCHERIIGAMRFYSAEKNFFNAQEIQLLEDLVTDICFALELSGNDRTP
ncbi:GAF domain-containing protein [Methanoregula sp.]|uniref:GAF domain-containing protein n=1 Tax=Methanoregula sp. TaxID=2052170 RepID=UPI0035664565